LNDFRWETLTVVTGVGGFRQIHGFVSRVLYKALAREKRVWRQRQGISGGWKAIQSHRSGSLLESIADRPHTTPRIRCYVFESIADSLRFTRYA